MMLPARLCGSPSSGAMRRVTLLLANVGWGSRSRHVDPVAPCVARLESYRLRRAAGNIFRMTKKVNLDQGFSRGGDINTTRPLTLPAEAMSSHAHQWGGYQSAVLEHCTARRMDQRRRATNGGADTLVEFLVSESAIRSNTSVCLTVVDNGDLAPEWGPRGLPRTWPASWRKKAWH